MKLKTGDKVRCISEPLLKSVKLGDELIVWKAFDSTNTFVSDSSMIGDNFSFLNYKDFEIVEEGRHKHAEQIIAWANGAEIQYYSNTHESWFLSRSPSWNPDTIYRIKPDIITINVSGNSYSLTKEEAYDVLKQLKEKLDEV